MNEHDIIKGLECLSGEPIKCAECKYKNKYKYRECCQQVARDTISLFYSKNKKIEELKQELMQCKLEKEMMHQTIEEIEFKIIEKFKDKLLSYRYGELNNLIHLTVHELDKIAKKIIDEER